MPYIAVRLGSDGLTHHGDADGVDDGGSGFLPWLVGCDGVDGGASADRCSRDERIVNVSEKRKTNACVDDRISKREMNYVFCARGQLRVHSLHFDDFVIRSPFDVLQAATKDTRRGRCPRRKERVRPAHGSLRARVVQRSVHR